MLTNITGSSHKIFVNMIKWKLEKRKISDLKDYPKNPRQLTKEQEHHLRTSLEKFGLIDKIIINQDNTIIGGHQRKKTLKKLEYKEVECMVPDRLLDEKEVEELNIRLNRGGEFDWDILANSYEINDLLEYGFSMNEFIGFDQDDQPTNDDENEDDQASKAKKCKMCPHCGKEL